ncbi:MAG TPA: peptide ABC transporter substrate-binding protein [Chloroflexota bacterium]
MSQSRLLTIATRYEMRYVIPKVYQSGIQADKWLFSAALTRSDTSGSGRPYLAEAPQLNTESWRVFPDGRMETIYRLRPGLTWHDGQPLEADDFVFAWQVYKNPTLADFTRSPQDLMEEVLAPDSRTLVIRWSAPYPDANAIQAEDLDPLPRHILDPALASLPQTGPEAFLSLGYWRQLFVGTGPYRLVQWEPGSFMEGVAFDGYVLGRPKIDHVILRIIPDDTVALNNMLAGSVDLAGLRFEQGQLLQRDWVPAGNGSVSFDLGGAQSEWVQLRPEYVAGPGLLDVRVRRAIAHSLDRPGINDGVFEGQGSMTDTMVPPTELFFSDVDRGVTHYPYDLRRAEQLMTEAGFTRDRDGLFADADGQRFSFPHITQGTGPEFERAELIMTDGWRKAGIEVRPSVLPSSQVGPGEQRHTFPGISARGGGRIERNWITPEIGTSDNRWVGENRSGWSNPEYDRFYAAFLSTLDRDERTRQFVQLQRLISENIPTYFTYFSVTSTMHIAALQGPSRSSTGTGTFTRGLVYSWNIHEWEWR